MPRYALSSLLATAAMVSVAYAQSPASSASAAFTPLANKNFPYNAIPYQADPANGVRGTQQGYNQCNSTTENQNSECQTSYFNSIDDFCLWAPPTPQETIGNTEGYEVAWCTKPGHGGRVIPPGALQGVQFMRTPSYIQVVGFIDQSKVNLQSNDSGGELDPHGADLRGNPIGGLMYSNVFGYSPFNYTQVPQWNIFIGGNAFCFKACDPTQPQLYNLCLNTYDLIGCSYNMPNAAQNGTFEACDGDAQDQVGVYTNSGGVVQTYSQPPLGPITSMPYQPKVPASSNCVTYSSAELYAAAASNPIFSSMPTNPPGGSGSGFSTSRASTGVGVSATGVPSGAAGLVATTMTTIMGVAFAVFFFA